MKLRGAVIGCGMVSEYHLRAWQRIPEVEIVTLTDPDLRQAKERRDAWASSAEVYPDIGSMLKRVRIDFVDILTPPSMHREHCLLAAEHDLHIICQKPLCEELEEAKFLVSELAAYSKQFCVHENHPFRPWFLDVQRFQRDGFFGDDQILSLYQHERSEPPEKFKVESEKGIVLDYGIHFVAMARALFGEPHTIEAGFAHINPRVKGESKADLALGFSNARAEIAVSWQDHETFEGGFLLRGSRGEARLDGTLTRGERSRFLLVEQGNTIRDEKRCPTSDFTESFYLFQKAFVDSVLKDSPPPQPARDNLKTLNSVFAAYAMTASGAKTQTLP